MKRQLKFKAKDKFSGKWIFGTYIHDPNLAFPDAIMQNGYPQPINPDTLCQLIAEYNGFEVYENDIISEPIVVDGEIHNSEEPIFYNAKEAAYCVDISLKKDGSIYDFLNQYETSNIRIAGNVYDKKQFPQAEKKGADLSDFPADEYRYGK